MDLLIEFHLDLFEKQPLEAHRNPDGEIQFKDTGDKFIDKWEAQIAKGETPDLLESFDEETLAKIDRLRKAGERRTMTIGGSFKDVHDAMVLEAQRQGVDAPSPRISVPRYRRSNFGDGTD